MAPWGLRSLTGYLILISWNRDLGAGSRRRRGAEERHAAKRTPAPPSSEFLTFPDGGSRFFCGGREPATCPRLSSEVGASLSLSPAAQRQKHVAKQRWAQDLGDGSLQISGLAQIRGLELWRRPKADVLSWELFFFAISNVFTESVYGITVSFSKN